MRHACDEWHEIKTVATAYRIGSKSKRMKVVSGQQQRAIAMSTWPNKSFDRSFGDDKIVSSRDETGGKFPAKVLG